MDGHRTNKCSTMICRLAVLSVFAITQAAAWGNGGNSNLDETSYGNSFARDWLYDSTSISLKVEGCVWGYVEDSEEVGCLEDESDEGTTNWYMMANCKRPQVAFSVYASTGSTTACNSNNLVGSFVTQGGLSEFIYSLQTYDGNFNYNGDDDSYGFDALPNCEQGNNGYLGLDCDENGGFAINYFNDQYCISRTGTSYNQLSSINTMMSNYEQCLNAWSYGDDSDNSLVHKLIYYSEPCTSLDYSMCQDNGMFDSRSSSSGSVNRSRQKKWSSGTMGGHKTWVTKLKYIVGGLFLLASFIMFTGILFTNRRRRRAMMMRKYRQAKKARRERNREGGSRKSRSASKKRSKSRNRDKSDGVFT